MITFLIVYKHNTSPGFGNIKMMFDGAPNLSEIQLAIINKHKWGINDFAIVNIIPIRSELLESN